MGIRVTYHEEDGHWWAESPDIDGFIAGGDTLDEVRLLVREGIAACIQDGLVASAPIEETTYAGDRLYGSV